ncbi:MAG TPA: cytochrome c [Cytophagaceae bacterium]|nr:cytochrome c [Cytophagaceae bacterium]
MYTGFKHLHVTVVLLFLLLYIIKTFLLVSNKNEQLDKLRAKTKIADMVLGSLMVITGFYLLAKGPGVQVYHYVKIIVAFSSIPIGIIAFKKRNKPMAIILLLLFIYVYGVAETKSLKFKKDKIEIPPITSSTVISSDSAATDIMAQNNEAVLANGKQIYNAACVSCHGEDGKLGTVGAKDLTTSTLSHIEKVGRITYGKGNMTPFQGQLSAQEIEAVTVYVDSMKK